MSPPHNRISLILYIYRHNGVGVYVCVHVHVHVWFTKKQHTIFRQTAKFIFLDCCLSGAISLFNCVIIALCRLSSIEFVNYISFSDTMIGK